MKHTWQVWLEFKPEDCWIGVFWRHTEYEPPSWLIEQRQFDMWICVLPMFPIHVRRIVEVERGAA